MGHGMGNGLKTATIKRVPIDDLCGYCYGNPPLKARLEPWMADLLLRAERLCAWLDAYGSPVNIHHLPPFIRNVRQLLEVVSDRDLDGQVFFARKANKCLAFVDAARDHGWGVDTASESELGQTLDRGVPGASIALTAAVKPASLMALCIQAGVLVVIDNADELALIRQLAHGSSKCASIALRVSGFMADGTKLASRFGFDIEEVGAIVAGLTGPHNAAVQLHGLHFHLGSSDPGHRVAAIAASVALIDDLRSMGHPLRFLDIGGGFRVSPLEQPGQWARFWDELRRALRGLRPPITYRNQGLGLILHGEEVVGHPTPHTCPPRPAAADLLAAVLDAPGVGAGETIAKTLARRDIQLRLEPGQSVLDGAGVTLARVEHVKRRSKGPCFAGLAMNRTQCRTVSDAYLCDPILIPRSHHRGETFPEQQGAAGSGFLAGAYCMESEVICPRLLEFPRGIVRGDMVLFPNTAGYFMHLLESRSHQIPLARNLVVDGSLTARVDPIDPV